jgi:hypothetical protein
MIAFALNGQVWWVRVVPPTFPSLLLPTGDFTLGCCDNNTHSIYIADGLDDRKFRKVLCHEITHAAMFSYDVMLTLDQEELLADIFSKSASKIHLRFPSIFRTRFLM